MADYRYVPNARFIESLYQSPMLAAKLKVQAGFALQAAEQIADAEANDGGYYKRDLDASRVGMDGGRVTAYLDAGNWKAHWMEWGSINNVPLHILQRAVETALRLPLIGG